MCYFTTCMTVTKHNAVFPENKRKKEIEAWKCNKCYSISPVKKDICLECNEVEPKQIMSKHMALSFAVANGCFGNRR